MSTAPSLFLRIALRVYQGRQWVARALPLVALGASLACGSLAGRNDNSRDGPPSVFLTPVAEAQQSGVAAYWLGETIGVGDLLFRVGRAEFEGGGETLSLRFPYYADLADRGTVGFTFYISGEGTYEEAVQRQVAKPLEMTRRDTTIRTWPAAAFSIAVGRRTNQKVVVGAPGSVVTVTAVASTDLDGRQVNPLNDQEVLLAVLNDNLRPYPE